ncbi:MAG: AMP-binding protein [Anaerolineae bacterium]|nr:AMP-binding protein [Anaerolineae bacterium]
MDSSAQTVPQYFLRQVQTQPESKIASRQKEFGIWREFTWADSYEQVRAFAMGLIALGVQRGDKICTAGDNDRQYLWAYIGLQAAGAAQVGLFTDARPTEMAYVIEHSDATFVLAKDQEQCDKMLEIRDSIPNVRKVIYWDDRGLWNYDDPWLMSFEEVQALGRGLVEREPGRFDTEVALGSAGDLAMICYTSGTTGMPKGVMLSHGNMMGTIEAYNQVDPRTDTDNHVSFLPLGWIAEPILGFAAHVYSGMIINFPEAPETVRQNIREIAPDMLFYNARLWDSLVGMVQVRMNDATWLNRTLYNRFLPVGYRMADATLTGRTPNVGLRMAYALGDRLVFAPLRDQLGLSRIRAAYTAGSSLSPDAMRFFHALGINLKQIYGSTEMTGGATVHRNNDIKSVSVGPTIPGVSARIAADGEIQIAGPTVMMGYYKDPANTAKDILVEDGQRWFRSGDAGYIDEDGHLIYLDRVKDMLTLANGERFSPQFIEGRLKFSPYIRDVMAVGGENRAFVTALIIIDFENVGQWAEKQRIPYTTFVDLSQKPQVYELVRRTVEEVNSSLPPAARIRRFVHMHKEFDADEAEMTRTRKLRRNVLFDRYDAIIEGMYDGAETIQVRAPVRYQDGSEGFIETEIQVMSLADAS